MDYNLLHAENAKKLVDLQGKRVLVIGCNTGRDCRHFAIAGAVEIHGVDVMDDIGSEFPDAIYHCVPVQKMTLPDNYFDLVYSFATMEHVSDIESGFRQMARVLAPKGIFYSVAAPLWHSRDGHHKPNFFSDYPWIHLRKTADEILDYCDDSGLSEKHGRDAMTHHIRYMLNPHFFNKRSSSDYLAACADLPGMKTTRNEIDYQPDNVLPETIYAKLAAKGYDRKDLLGLTHTYIGTKRQNFANLGSLCRGIYERLTIFRSPK